MSSLLLTCFRPTLDAIFGNIPFTYRWRLLLLQPIALASYLLKALPWTFSKAYTVQWIPTRNGRSVRCLVFKPPSNKPKSKPLHPIHLDIHGGAFLGGIPEYDAFFADMVARRTGAVVICTTYRAAPVYTFPAAHDDVDDVIGYLHKHAEETFGADPKLLTVSGVSAGGNLALAASQQPECQPSASTAIKATLLFCAAIDLRVPPTQKAKPPNFPTHDPLFFLQPLFDSYAAPRRTQNLTNPGLNPILSTLEHLPSRLLLIIPTLDILVSEQRSFVARLKREIAEKGLEGERMVEGLEFEGCLHGWLDLPSFLIDKSTRTRAFDAAIEFLREAHRAHGWTWEYQRWADS